MIFKRFLSNLSVFLFIVYISGVYCRVLYNDFDSKTDNLIGYESGTINLTLQSLKDKVKFCLFTGLDEGKSYKQLLLGNSTNIKNSNFNKSLNTTFIIHGFYNDINSDVIQKIKDALLTRGNQNIIAVDWGSIADTIFYNEAANSVKDVGNYLGQFISYMTSEGLDLKQTHLVGHSLGAHVAGFAGSYLSPLKVNRITGLDPAKPLFTDAGPDERLDIRDAEFVDCIHTCSEELGLGKPVCSADFYPNFGFNFQPGCPLYDVFGACSHSRSYQFYAESILKDHNFYASKCNKVPLHDSNSCSLPEALMGHSASPRHLGIFYVATQDQFPFSRPFSLRLPKEVKIYKKIPLMGKELKFPTALWKKYLED